MSISTIMREDATGQELVSFAETTAAALVRDSLTRAQIRGIFSEVRKIEAMWSQDPVQGMRRLNMLKPKLDYQTERNKPVKGLRDVLVPAIDEVGRAVNDQDRNRRFARFLELFEAILAYHRAKGARS
jgi:CRISPR-associated protein Csm2